MSDRGPVIGEEDEFERLYTERFRTLAAPHGQFVQYERDRASLDIGLHLTSSTGAQTRVTHTRIWFQLKGLHKETCGLKDFEGREDVPVAVKVEHLRFWFAAPEPVYLAVYIEAANTFVVEDVREIVHRQWGEDFLAPGKFREGQETVTVRVRTEALLTPELLADMRRHQSMRIDGPFFRGRPLGHRLDPLRCILGSLEPPLYVSIVQRLLDVHGFRPTLELDRLSLFHEAALSDEHVLLTEGVLHNTFEWVPSDFTQFGIGPDDDFRIEGAPQVAHGPVAVCIHGNPGSYPVPERLSSFAAGLRESEIRRLLVFANTNSDAYFGAFFSGCRGTGIECMPHLLRDLGYNLLTATVVYMEFRESVSWRVKNYLWK